LVSKVFYLNSDKYPAIVNDYQQVKEHVQNKQSTDYACLFEALPPVRRTLSIPDKIKHGEIATALGMASLALINLPEDISDIKGAINQLKGAAPKYDYTKCQHPFSFVKGTLLNDFADITKATNKDLAEKILNSDKILAQTVFGEKVLSILGVEKVDKVTTKIHAIGSTEKNPKFIKANVYEGTLFGKTTARMMERTTKWGIIAMALLETPKIAKEFCNGDTISEKVENGSKQTLKAGINVAVMTAGIGYMGAIGAQKFGPIGSLVGMGAGAILGGFGSKKIQGYIS